MQTSDACVDQEQEKLNASIGSFRNAIEAPLDETSDDPMVNTRMVFERYLKD